jgi:hypothetical protein
MAAQVGGSQSSCAAAHSPERHSRQASATFSPPSRPTPSWRSTSRSACRKAAGGRLTPRPAVSYRDVLQASSPHLPDRSCKRRPMRKPIVVVDHSPVRGSAGRRLRWPRRSWMWTNHEPGPVPDCTKSTPRCRFGLWPECPYERGSGPGRDTRSGGFCLNGLASLCRWILGQPGAWPVSTTFSMQPWRPGAPTVLPGGKLAASPTRQSGTRRAGRSPSGIEGHCGASSAVLARRWWVTNPAGTRRAPATPGGRRR